MSSSAFISCTSVRLPTSRWKPLVGAMFNRHTVSCKSMARPCCSLSSLPELPTCQSRSAGLSIQTTAVCDQRTAVRRRRKHDCMNGGALTTAHDRQRRLRAVGKLATRPWLMSTARLMLSSRVGSGGSAPAGDVHPGCVNPVISTVRSDGVLVVSVFRGFGGASLKPRRLLCPVAADRRTAPAAPNHMDISAPVNSLQQRCERMRRLRLAGVTAGGVGALKLSSSWFEVTRMNKAVHVRGCSGHSPKPKA
jgi:hypothetical protein